jgi:hypothetical protein
MCDVTHFECSNTLGTTGQTRTVYCNQGYEGGGDIQCLDTGFFQTTTCNPKECTSTQIENSDKSGTNSINGHVGDTVSVNCNAGYIGTGTVSCTIDQIFTSLTCSPIPCTETIFENSNRDSSLPLVGSTTDTIEVVCNDGYKGGGNSVCQSDGKFLPTFSSFFEKKKTHSHTH